MAQNTSSYKRHKVVQDFLLAAGGTLPAPWSTQDTSAAGSPTLDFVSDARDGEFKLAHDATDEAQNLTLYFGDQLVISPASAPIFEAKLKLSAIFTADQRLVAGLASARAATLDNVADNAWFRVEGADLSIKYESDDGTTDDDDNDSGEDLTADTYVVLRVDMSDLSAVKFVVDGKLVGTTDCSEMAATDLLQPFIELQKDAGTDTHSVTIDYVAVEWARA